MITVVLNRFSSVRTGGNLDYGQGRRTIEQWSFGSYSPFILWVVLFYNQTPFGLPVCLFIQHQLPQLAALLRRRSFVSLTNTGNSFATFVSTLALTKVARANQKISTLPAIRWFWFLR